MDKAPKTKKISLSFIADREGRTRFFIELMGGIPGFDLLGGASKIGVARQISTEKSSFSNEDDEMPGVEEENAEALGVVNNAFFEGSSVTESPEYELAKRNSFIYRAVWMVKNKGGAGEKIELEALFRDPTSGNGFEYQIKGIYPEKGANDYYKTSQKPKPSEKRKILDLIESTAHRVICQLAEEYKNREPDRVE